MRHPAGIEIGPEELGGGAARLGSDEDILVMKIAVGVAGAVQLDDGFHERTEANGMEPGGLALSAEEFKGVFDQRTAALDPPGDRVGGVWLADPGEEEQRFGNGETGAVEVQMPGESGPTGRRCGWILRRPGIDSGNGIALDHDRLLVGAKTP